MITIIDYGMGNTGSILNMLRKLGITASVTNNLGEIRKAKKIILPGVGAFDNAMSAINQSGLREVLDEKALTDQIPILGICLGMQLLTLSSQEGEMEGLGWINAQTLKFKFDNIKMKIPHMGWNYVQINNPNELTRDLPKNPKFYFVHSYYVDVENQSHSILKSEYGIKFDSAVCHKNIYGAQFHPEKSHKYGMKMLENFANV